MELLTIQEYFDSRLGHELTKEDIGSALANWKDRVNKKDVEDKDCSFCLRYDYDCNKCPLIINNTCKLGNDTNIFNKWWHSNDDGNEVNTEKYAKIIYNAIAEIWNFRYPEEKVKIYRIK